jgi:hypothetical protein
MRVNQAKCQQNTERRTNEPVRWRRELVDQWADMAGVWHPKPAQQVVQFDRVVPVGPHQGSVLRPAARRRVQGPATNAQGK